MKLIWHGHACFELRLSSGSVVFDPYCPGSVPGLSLPELSADAVICSHGHSDHCCAEAVKLSGREPGFKVTQIPTFHDGQRGKLRGRNLCTVIEGDGLRIAHLGDLGHPLSGDELSRFGRLDLLMIPVGGVYTVDAAQAKELVEALRPRITVPMHYKCASSGLRNVAPVEDFLRLWPAEDIRLLNGPEYETTAPENVKILVFSL
ncbi:MAG: MBL fold metallo-hydrolase [Oscillospiraceae bacterium]